jgi:hypothetical protein
MRAFLQRSLVSLFVLLAACDHLTNFSSSRGSGEGGPDAQIVEEDAATDAGLSLGTSEAGTVALCHGRPCECSNDKDDDGDGEIDGFDSECTGPFDDYEGSFRVNDVKEGNPKCADCFYDNNPGSGNDRCQISTSCTLTGMPANGGNSCKTKTCEPAQPCIDHCEPITPNGCDCFGCCEVTYSGVTAQVRLVSTCKLQLIADTKACPRCVLSPTCQNPCERCELCPGKTRADLPKDCVGEGGVNYSCDGRDVCGASRDCAFSEYCSQGCCVQILL